MKDLKQFIHCPDCKSPIYFDPYDLIKGVQFKCSNQNCTAAISLTEENSKNQVASAMQKFEEQYKQNSRG